MSIQKKKHYATLAGEGQFTEAHLNDTSSENRADYQLCDWTALNKYRYNLNAKNCTSVTSVLHIKGIK